MLSKILEKAVLKVDLRKDVPVALLAHMIICEFYGMMTCWCMSDGIFEPKDWTRQFFEAGLFPILQKYLTKEVK